MRLGDWGCGACQENTITRNWTQNSIYHIQCDQCNEQVEFFKDDKKRRCSNDHLIINPHYGKDCCE